MNVRSEFLKAKAGSRTKNAAAATPKPIATTDAMVVVLVKICLKFAGIYFRLGFASVLLRL